MSNKPKIRFKGFTDDWEQRKLGDIMDVGSVKRIHQSDWTNSGVRFLRARDIVAEYNGEKSDDLLYISKEKYDQYSKESGKVKINDLLVTGVGTIGVPKQITSSQPIYFKDGNIIWFKNNNYLNGAFFYYSFSGLTIQDFIKNEAGIGTVGTYTISSGKRTPISIPTKEEQCRISELCMSINNLITLHQRKIDKLKKIKKSLLENMFPKDNETVPKIRFKGFTDDWEQRKLDYHCSFAKGRGYSKNDLCNDGTPIILYGRLYTKYQTVISDVNTYTQKNSDSVYSKGIEVIVPASGETSDEIARASYIKLAGVILGGDLNIIFPDKDINPSFLALLITYCKPHYDLAKRAQGKSVVHIHNSDLKDIEIMLPNIDEQSKISQLFVDIDKLITLHQRKCEKLKKIKKSLLENMFV